MRARALCLGLVLLCSSAFAAPARGQGETAEERYGFLVGLCDEKEWELAAREAKAFLRDFPEHEKGELARYRLATALFETGDRKGAREHYAALAPRERFEFRAEVLFRLGQCELALDNPAAAAAAFEAVRAIPDSYLALPADFFLGEARFAAGELAAAEQSYARVLASPRSAEYARDARYGLAWCAFRAKRYDEALKRTAEFLERHGDDPVAGEMRYLAAESHLAAGRAKEALAAFSQVGDGPFLERALRGAAFAAAELGDHRGAAERFGALLRRFPRGEHAAEARLHHGIELLRGGAPAEAIAPLREAASAGDPQARYWLARAQLDAKEAEAALATLDAALAAKPPKELAERLHVLRGDALTELGRGEEAARSYSRAQSDYALYAAAIVEFNAGRAAEAAKLARSLLEKFPESPYAAEMRIVVGEAALAAKRYGEAQAAFDGVARSEIPETLRARALSRSAWCRFLGGDAAGAAQGFAELIERAPESPEGREARYMLGRCLDSQGNAAGAVRAWREYLAADEGGAHAAEALAGLARLDLERASQWSERLARDFPDSPSAVAALLDVADRDAREDRRDRAIATYRDILERFPGHALADLARYGLAWCAYEAGEHAEAARELDELSRRDALAPELARSALELLVWCRGRAGDGAGALEAYRRFAKAGAEPRKMLGAARVASAALGEAGGADAASFRERRAIFDDLLAKARGDRALQADVLIESAWIAIDAKQADEAEAAVRTAWKLGASDASRPTLAEATFFAGEQRFEAGDDARAADLYALAAQHGAPAVQAQARYKRGFALLRSEKLDEAAASFAEVVERHGDHELAGESAYLLGECRFRAKRWAEAADALAKLVESRPKHASVPKALFRLGVARGELGAWRECEAALVELARHAPDHESAAEADLWRGRAIAARGDARNAKAAFERVLARDKGLAAARARIELGRLASAAGDDEEALAQFLKVALLYDGGEVVAEASFLAGEALERLGRSDKARARFREIVEKHAGSPFAARAKARLDELGS